MFKLRKVESGSIVGWEVHFRQPHGNLRAQGTADKRFIRGHVRRMIHFRGPRKTAAMMGCDCTSEGIIEGIDNLASEVALRNLAGMLGVSPLRLIRYGASQALNKGLKAGLYANPLYRTYQGIKTAKRLLRGGGGGRQQESEASEDSQNPQEDEQPKDSQNPQQEQEQGDQTMGAYDIGRHHNHSHHRSHGLGAYDIACALDGLNETQRTALTFAPGGAQALQAMRLAKLAKSNNSRVSSAAKTLHSAKRGDAKSLRKISILKRKAKTGDPEAKDAMKRLKKVDRIARAGLGTGGKTLPDFYRAGIQ